MEEHNKNRSRLENKLKDLEKMVMMQEQTIRVLLQVNQEPPLQALTLKNVNSTESQADHENANVNDEVPQNLSMFQDKMKDINRNNT